MDLPSPAYIQFYPTVRCNQSCSFCFNHKGDTFAELSYDRALDLLAILSAHHIREIDIMGGEPFLLPWMPDFIRASRGCGIAVNASTNGSIPGALARLDGIDAEGITLGISLEGSDAEKHGGITGSGNFGSAIESIRVLRRLGLDPLVKTVVCRETAEDIRDIVKLLQGLGVRRYYLIHMDLMTRDVSQIRKGLGYSDFLSFYERLRDEHETPEINRVNASCFDRRSLPSGVRCAGGVRKLCILPDGTAYPCNLFQGTPEMILGNIFLDDLREIWRNPKLAVFRKFRGNRCTVTACENKESCTGGCPAHGLYHSGNADSPDIRCLA